MEIELLLLRQLNVLWNALGAERVILFASLAINYYLFKMHLRDGEQYVDLLIKVVKIEQENQLVERLESKIDKQLEKVD